MRGKARGARESSTADGASAAAAMLRKGGHGKREKNDRGPEHHGNILRLI
jgi:hypothetical protein